MLSPKGVSETLRAWNIYIPKIFRPSKNSTGAAVSPYSHIREKNQMPLSPMQKSAGVKVI